MSITFQGKKCYILTTLPILKDFFVSNDFFYSERCQKMLLHNMIPTDLQDSLYHNAKNLTVTFQFFVLFFGLAKLNFAVKIVNEWKFPHVLDLSCD